MQHTFSVTFGMLSGSNISFWSPFTVVRSRGADKPTFHSDEKWSGLSEIDFERWIGKDIIYTFKTTAVYEAEAEEGEPWQEPDEPDVTERPCTWTIQMKHVAWVRTIYMTEEEVKARVPH